MGEKKYKCKKCGDVIMLQENEEIVKCMCDYLVPKKEKK